MAGRHALLLLLLALLAPVAGYLVGREAGGALPDLSAVDDALVRAARAASLDPDLLRALVAAESSGRIDARSGAGALGLTQLLPSTAREQAERLGLPPPGEAQLLSDPALNLRLGAAYLAWLLERFDGEEAFALAAYNAGRTSVLRWRSRAVDADAPGVVRREGYAATVAYVDRVRALRARYAQQPRPGAR